MRTTYGRVSRAGSASLCWSLDKIGPLCRSAHDCGLVLNAIAGFDKDDPATSRRRFVYPVTAHSRKLKVAVIKGSYEGAQPEIRENFERSVKVISNFADVSRDVEFPDYPYGAILGTILYSEGTAAFRDLVDTGRMREMQNQADRVGGYIGMTVSAVDYLQAQRVRRWRGRRSISFWRYTMP
jgi:aspartyl-tRNA(Asn)/glutamyl-tRNA(Gln) amidotransferase subunit A